jgi:amidase
VGKTNAPEFGILNVTEPRRYGPTRNPWDLDRTPGGSSRRLRAATAAGMVPIAHGNDGGGSIRIPAACCGLVGLKASRGRVSIGPGPAVRASWPSTESSRARWRTRPAPSTCSPAPSWATPRGRRRPPSRSRRRSEREPSGLRIALSVKPPIEAPLDPVFERAVNDTGELLASLGHEVEEIELPWGGPESFADFTKLYAGGIGATVAFAARVSGQEPTPENVEKLSLELYRRRPGLSALDYIGAEVSRRRSADRR